MDRDALDPVWKALANPVRRKMLDLLRDEAMTTGDLDAAFPELSRFAVMQHLDVLEEARLIVIRRVGRQRFNYLNAVPIRQIYERWVSRYEGHWASALLAMRDTIEGEAEGETGGPRPARKKKATKKTKGRLQPGGAASKKRTGSKGVKRHGKGEDT